MQQPRSSGRVRAGKSYRACQPEQALRLPLDLRDWVRGERASRKIAQRLDEDVAFRTLAAGNRPDFRTIHLARLEGLFEQLRRLVRVERRRRKLWTDADKRSPICASPNILNLPRRLDNPSQRFRLQKPGR